MCFSGHPIQTILLFVLSKLMKTFSETRLKRRYTNTPCVCVNRRVPMLFPDCPLCGGEGVYPQVVDVEPTEAGLDWLFTDICRGLV